MLQVANYIHFVAQVHTNGKMLDDEILADPEVQDAIKNEGKVHRTYDIINVDRSTLGRVGGAVAKQHGDSGFAGKISIDFNVSTPSRFSHSVMTPLMTSAEACAPLSAIVLVGPTQPRISPQCRVTTDFGKEPLSSCSLT